MGLQKLLYLQGVGAEFVSCSGENIVTPEQDRIGILHCMLTSAAQQRCEPVISAEQVDERIYQLDAMPWTQRLPLFQHTTLDNPELSVFIPSDSDSRLTIELQLEGGEQFQLCIDTAKFAANPRIAKITGHYHVEDCDYLHYRLLITQALLESDICYGSLQMSVLPYIGLGYHRVRISDEAEFASACTHFVEGQWLVAPVMSYQSGNTRSLSNNRLWGLSIQLFSLRSETQWGIGDFADLAVLIELVANEGGSFIQLNPLHALDIANPQACSPYSPSDRRRLNPLYINLEMVPEFPQLFCDVEPNAAVGTASELTIEFKAIKQQVNRADWLDYQLVSLHKYRIFKLLYRQFIVAHVETNSVRGQRFSQFIADNGDSLRQFCELQLSDTAAMSEFSGLDSRFFAYLQFVAEQQLSQCQAQAKRLGMAIGLVRDMAVGVASNSVEVRADNSPFCQHASIGAPPDPFAPQGQNWGLTPFDPIALKHEGYQHFIQLLRSNMQSCGALRIDHVMSLLRLWWWPRSEDLGNGAYVYYPLDTLLAIVCIESQRAQCLIIGEDLGLIPPEIVSKLSAAGVLSNDLFYFSRDGDGFALPANYPADSLMMLANHDVPPLLAWWQADDLQLRRSIGLIDNDELLQSLISQREFDKQQLLKLLQSQGQFDGRDVNSIHYPELLKSWLAVTAAGNAHLFSVQLCDLVCDNQPINIPGTWLQYPNWQRRLALSLTELAADKQVHGLLLQLQSSRQQGAESDREIDTHARTQACTKNNISTNAHPNRTNSTPSHATSSLQPNGLNRYD